MRKLLLGSVLFALGVGSSALPGAADGCVERVFVEKDGWGIARMTNQCVRPVYVAICAFDQNGRRAMRQAPGPVDPGRSADIYIGRVEIIPDRAPVPGSYWGTRPVDRPIDPCGGL